MSSSPNEIESLRQGDACEVKDTTTGSWVHGIVISNARGGIWLIEVNGDRWYRHIEDVRCEEQREVWTCAD